MKHAIYLSYKGLFMKCRKTVPLTFFRLVSFLQLRRYAYRERAGRTRAISAETKIKKNKASERDGLIVKTKISIL